MKQAKMQEQITIRRQERELNVCLYKLRFGIELSHLFLDDATAIGTHISPIILQDFEEPHK
uniref:Uncharacterized protein n=1 Tax=Glossina palpalis gambiensis TaxID=67801 RepID=A0A1B0B5Z7_9MUSC